MQNAENSPRYLYQKCKFIVNFIYWRGINQFFKSHYSLFIHNNFFRNIANFGGKL